MEGRQLRAKSRGVIPSHLAPLLQRVGVDVEGWCDVVENFGKLFKQQQVAPRASLKSQFVEA